MDKSSSINLAIGSEPTGAGFGITVNGRLARTPQENPLVVSTPDLARAIVDELTACPGLLSGRGLNDPAAGPCWRLSLAAIDLVANDPASADRIAGDMADFAATDLVCYRASGPEELVRRQAVLWDPLLDWFAQRFGTRLKVCQTALPFDQPEAAHAAVRRTVLGLAPGELVALSLAAGASGSIVIGLALVEGQIDADTAFRAAMLEELFQAERWGDDPEAEKARAGRKLDLKQAESFVHLLKRG